MQKQTQLIVYIGIGRVGDRCPYYYELKEIVMAHHLATKSGAMEQCIQRCSDCHDVCLETVTWCLEQGGEHASPSHIKLLLDCAQICETSADFMLRGSDAHGRTCAVCAELCERCADDCEQMDGDQMQRCAEECRRCAESCREMAA